MHEVKPRLAASAVKAAIVTAMTTFKIVFVLSFITANIKFAAKILHFFDICKRERDFFCILSHFFAFSSDMRPDDGGWSGRRGYTPHGTADVTKGHNAPRTEATRRPTTEDG